MRLMTISEEKQGYETALEVCAGGRLYNVVVESDTVGSQLLSKGKLQKRTTFIPLNKIKPNVASSDRVTAAMNLAPGQIDLALSVIDYKDCDSPAMKYVFGSTLIAVGTLKFYYLDQDSAKCVTFDKKVRMRSVTLDGDVYDPSGKLSGGSRANNGGGVLVKMQRLKKLRSDLDSVSIEISSLEAKLAQVKKENSAYEDISGTLEQNRHQLESLQSRLSSNACHKLAMKVVSLKESLASTKASFENAEREMEVSKENIEFLENEIKELGVDRGSKIKDLEVFSNLTQFQISELKKSVSRNGPEVSRMEQAIAIAKEEHGILKTYTS
jgi:structural maintenance of chromosome 2